MTNRQAALIAAASLLAGWINKWGEGSRGEAAEYEVEQTADRFLLWLNQPNQDGGAGE